MDITEKDRIDDQGKKVKPFLTDEQYYIFYAVCHMTGMVSACANPVIYGYLNENFNREFRELFRVGRGCCCCCRGSGGDKGANQTAGVGAGRKSLVIKKQADKENRVCKRLFMFIQYIIS